MRDLMQTMLLADTGDATVWMPPQASSFAGEVDSIFYFIYWICVFFFVAMMVAMFWFMAVYRRPPGARATSKVTHNTLLELAWSILPSFLLVVMFWWGFKVYMDMRFPAANSYEIQVNAKRWSWLFTYPNGLSHDELHVPYNRSVRLIMSAEDVLHSLFIPAFRIKRDLVPGRYTEVSFIATRIHPEGGFPLYCAEYCGMSHSNMQAKVFVETDMETWLKNADPLSEEKLTKEEYEEYKKDPAAFVTKHPEKKLEAPEVMGKKIFAKYGCTQCHQVDGATKGIGPNLKGVYGAPQPIIGGSPVVADENYLKESILEPTAKIVVGAGVSGEYKKGMMPTFKGQIKDRELDMVIAYIKSLK